MNNSHLQIPIPRELQTGTEFEKTILVIRGSGSQGKTTLCSKIFNNDIGYISFDQITDKLDWCNIAELHALHKTFEKPHHNIDKVNVFINGRCAKSFIKQAFDSFIRVNSNQILMVDGHFFSLPNNYKVFEDRCRKYNYRLWTVDRHL